MSSSSPGKIALFGGIYANHLALEAALADIASRNITGIYCLGDLGAFGPNPDKVYPLLKAHGVKTLAGNYDDSLARDLPDCQSIGTYHSCTTWDEGNRDRQDHILGPRSENRNDRQC